MIKLGVTGGIGSGKSTVCELLTLLNIPVYDSDKEAKRLMNCSEGVRKEIEKLFGTAFHQNGEVNFSVIAKQVFKHSELLQGLNAIVHPAVFADFGEWCSRQADTSIVICESAILYETGFYKLLDKVVVIEAPEEIRIERVIERSTLNREQVVERMNHQQKNLTNHKPDFVIVNDGTTSLIAAVNQLLDQLRSEVL